MLSQKQTAWFYDAGRSEAERIAFLAKGDAEAGQVINTSSAGPTAMFLWTPMIRDVRVSEDFYPNRAKALSFAKKKLFEYRQTARKTGFVLDEHALGIDGEAMRHSELAERYTFRFERIVHLGMLVHSVPGDQLEDVIDYLFHTENESSWDGLPAKLKSLVKNETLDDEEVSEGFLEICGQEGVCGLLGQAATPVKQYSADGKSASFTWGHYHTAWFYGENLDEIVRKAAAWCADKEAAGRVKAKREAREARKAGVKNKPIRAKAEKADA